MDILFGTLTGEQKDRHEGKKEGSIHVVPPLSSSANTQVSIAISAAYATAVYVYT